jgi:hypothetical protein
MYNAANTGQILLHPSLSGQELYYSDGVLDFGNSKAFQYQRQKQDQFCYSFCLFRLLPKDNFRSEENPVRKVKFVLPKAMYHLAEKLVPKVKLVLPTKAIFLLAAAERKNRLSRIYSIF